MRTIAALAFAVVAAQGSPAKADHYLSSADPTVVAGFQQLLQVYGNACQLGNPQSCSVYQLLDGEAIQTLSAGYDCQQGDQQACDYYNYSVGELNQIYTQTTQALQSGSGGNVGGGFGGNPLGSTHQQRLQQIQNWGQQRLDWGRQQSAIQQQNHDSFLERLRQ